MSVGKKQLSPSKLGTLFKCCISSFQIYVSSGLVFSVSLDVPMELQPGMSGTALSRGCASTLFPNRGNWAVYARHAQMKLTFD
jgi:hypothetical protein